MRDWRGTLIRFVYPEIGDLPVAAIDTALVLRVLKPIWETKTKTAVDVRSRIELVLNWAKIHGRRDGENPARWKGHLDNALPKPSKVTKVKHHPAMPYTDLPGFVIELQSKTAVGARALEWTILAAARSEETLGAVWAEIDAEKRIWTIPAARMKADADHRVPLTDRMLEILAGQSRDGVYVFPGQHHPKRFPAPQCGICCAPSDHQRKQSTVSGPRFAIGLPSKPPIPATLSRWRSHTR